MVDKKLLQEISSRLVDVYDPVTIYLFGSYAWGKPTENSDIDLLVVIESSEEKKYKRPVQGRLALYGLGIAKDLLVLTREEFEHYVQDKASLSRKISEQGEVLYAKA